MTLLQRAAESRDDGVTFSCRSLSLSTATQRQPSRCHFVSLPDAPPAMLKRSGLKRKAPAAAAAAAAAKRPLASNTKRKETGKKKTTTEAQGCADERPLQQPLSAEAVAALAEAYAVWRYDLEED